ncbi:helix-turn-helix transcriptional regulator [Agromyces intestinalis]|uniref:Helix-turn-helix transcriptional regulator n=1 Tax=Agromyces intestinalis TaxID=2592652 RepID=A0A5C1YG81_9MICO|nr:AraC family transcriptional regulator [Agromyces intestinalis]QEO14628.1 helix-turn-helix transcriptional regulator [Agromyces intestinalis]
MRNDLAAPHPLRETAEQHFYSSYHFHRLFRQATGVPLAQFLGALRMQRAKELLAFTGTPAWEIASIVGYQSVGTFSTQFSRLTGISPARFREVARWIGDMTVQDVLAILPHVSTPQIQIRAHHPPDTVDRAYFFGMFAEAIPRGIPSVFAFIDPEGRTRLEGGTIDRPYVGLGMAVPISARLIEITTYHEDILVAGRTVEPGNETGPLDFTFRPADLGDPPLLSAVPLTYLASVVPTELERAGTPADTAWSRAQPPL